MAHEDEPPTDPNHAASSDEPRGVISGEAIPPDEHTARVRARRRGPGSTPSSGPPSVHRIHDIPKEPSVSELAEFSEMTDRARRQRRKERDRRAERRALYVAIAAFAVLGVAGWLVVNFVFVEPPASEAGEPGGDGEGEGRPSTAVLRADGGAGDDAVSTRLSSKHEGVFDLPALRDLATQGLTVVAEGLPEVETHSRGPGIPVLATIETCRFAYGVWEFSPNRRFRFLPTCSALEGQVLVGAYEVEAGEVRMSPLISRPAEIVSTFHVEKPSTMRSRVTIRVAEREVAFDVEQRVTVIRAGLEGEGFRGTYAPRNTVSVPGATMGPRGGTVTPEDLLPPRNEPRAPDRPAGGGRQEAEDRPADPLLELLEHGPGPAR